jgi:hypothetical protein
MSTQNYFVLTAAQRSSAVALNGENCAIDPRAIDSASPGSGINTNQDAIGFDVGDAVPLVGNYVAPVRIVNDPAYLAEVPDMITFLLTLPAALLENETIFLPPEE